jgi:rsbT co-antagonist protein RsbR
MLVWVPLMRKRVSYGVYVLYDRRNRGVSGDEKRILEQIGTMISLAIISNHHHNQQRHAEQLLRDSYEEVSIPVIQAWDSILAIPVIGAVDSRRLDRLMDTMLVRIRDTRSKIVIIDITGSHSLDSNATSHLINIAQAAKLLGATCVITGIKPEIAQTAVRLGLDMELGCLTTRKTLQDGLRYGLQKIGYSIEIRDTT